MLSDTQDPSNPRSKKLNVLPSNPNEKSEDLPVEAGRFPSWLHRPLPRGGSLPHTQSVLSGHRLHTVCEEAKCPNRFECWSRKTATFLTMGKECTRNCGFCDINFSKKPRDLEADEPQRIAESVQALGLRHVVITMVARDDLPDGGSAQLVRILNEIRRLNPCSTLEVLTSDFDGNIEAWMHVLRANPEVFNHNIETVRRLSPRVRHKATYERTLELLRYVSSHRSKKTKVKSGIMIGLGEEEEEVFQTLKDLKESGCDIVTIGQYLQPRKNKLLVKAFITPEQFKKYEEFGYQLGLSYVYSGPFIRSSYNADLIFENANHKEMDHGP